MNMEEDLLTKVICYALKEGEKFLDEMAEVDPKWALIRMEIYTGLTLIMLGSDVQSPCK